MQRQIGSWDRADEGSGIKAIQAADAEWDLSRAALDDVEGFDSRLPRTERDILPAPPSPASRELESRLLQRHRTAALGTLSAGMAHEIKNPLTYVRLNLKPVLRRLGALLRGPAR